MLIIYQQKCYTNFYNRKYLRRYNNSYKFAYIYFWNQVTRYDVLYVRLISNTYLNTIHLFKAYNISNNISITKL